MLHTTTPSADNAVDRSAPLASPASVEEEDQYFKTNKEPDYLPQIRQQVEEFIKLHDKQSNRKIAVVTSGGTTVPLENNTVRFIDNFSAGTRGATSTEYLVSEGYAVIFLHRQFSVMPYSRHYTHTENFLDYMDLQDDSGKEEEAVVVVKEEYQKQMASVLREYKTARKQQKLLYVPFTTVTQYLFTLRLVSEVLGALTSSRPKVVFYLAAAVSDFFLPQSRVSEHKIQSSGGSDSPLGGKLVIDLDPVPKFLRRLVGEWMPGALIVSFKLETDSNILISKARQALDRYSHQLVIGNLLQTRKTEVIFVTKETSQWIKLSKEQENQGVEIESLIIPEVVKIHEQWINSHI